MYSNIYLLNFTYSKNNIDKKLIPWKQFVTTSCCNNDDEIINYYQFGVAINNEGRIRIVTPFFVQMLYSDCNIIGEMNIKLKLINYCYFSRIAIYETDDVNIYLDNVNFTSANYILSDINDKNFYFHTFGNINIKCINNEICFKNMINPNIYSFVFIESEISKEDKETYEQQLISGTPLYNDDNIFMGFIYNINDKINVIPTITINKIINDEPLTNIYFNADINENDNTSLLVSQSYNRNILVGDIICKLDEIPLSPSGLILNSQLNINIPLHTYIWYSNTKSHTLGILRNKDSLNINIKTENIKDVITPSVTMNTNYIIKDGVIYCELNLLLDEWLVNNNIILKNISYLQFYVNPFFKLKNNCLFVGLTNIDEHPKIIQETLKKYVARIYNIRDEIELFTVINMNMNMIENNDIHKLTLLDSNEKELILSWLC